MAKDGERPRVQHHRMLAHFWQQEWGPEASEIKFINKGNSASPTKTFDFLQQTL